MSHDEDPKNGCSGILMYTFFPGWLIALFAKAIWSGFNDLAERTSSFVEVNRGRRRHWILWVVFMTYLAFMTWQGQRLWLWNVKWTDLWTAQFFIAGVGTPAAMLWRHLFPTDDEA